MNNSNKNTKKMVDRILPLVLWFCGWGIFGAFSSAIGTCVYGIVKKNLEYKCGDKLWIYPVSILAGIVGAYLMALGMILLVNALTS